MVGVFIATQNDGTQEILAKRETPLRLGRQVSEWAWKGGFVEPLAWVVLLGKRKSHWGEDY